MRFMHSHFPLHTSHNMRWQWLLCRNYNQTKLTPKINTTLLLMGMLACYERTLSSAFTAPSIAFRRKSSHSSSQLSLEISSVTRLKDELKRFRTQQSQFLKKSAYTIFSDKSLDEICESLPTTNAELLKVRGIGPKKVEMFGPRIVNIVSCYKEQIQGDNGSMEVKGNIDKDNDFNIKPSQNNENSASDETNEMEVTLKKTQLREDLKKFRLQQSGTYKFAYTVFTNAALEGIYTSLPTTKSDLLDVKGIGSKKVEMFGDDILAIVSKYVNSNVIEDEAEKNSALNSVPLRPDRIDSESLSQEQRDAADIPLGIDRKNVFITGSAGSGKSYLLKYIVQELRKQTNESGERRQVGICAPTGVAAIIVGGSTLHSFFGIGLGTGSTSSLVKKVSKSNAAMKRIDDTDVLVIDECSMLSSDLLEKLDAVVREVRKDGSFRDQPFGGMQIVAFGDFFQLPPVTKTNFSDDWNDRRHRAFCFESYVWLDLGLSENVIELKEIHRQGSENFVTLLNKVRIGTIEYADIEYLNSKCLISDSNPLPTDGILPTRLYVLNKDVDQENISRLNDLDSEEVICQAFDIWREKMPVGTSASIKKQMKDSLDKETPDEVRLKVGAQVMLTRNKDLDKNLVNGSRGIIEGFVRDMDSIVPIVRFDNGIVTKIAPVESIRYNPDGGLGCLVRMQVPLKLAWAITIHKSQGSTLTRALLDISKAFEYGQCYVALSRVKSLDGLWLEKPARLNNILVSSQVIDFFGRRID